ncbi:MAG TPA: hypothetical protein VJN92_21700 [Candidatus Acidoferrum sp.]|nr:hypothetical protein [Candidatus Acidoferrum sp.]
MDAQGANSDRDFQSVLGIAIEEQKPGSGIKGKGFPQLLDDPEARGVFGDVEVQNASAFVADDEEAIEYAERGDHLEDQISNFSRYWRSSGGFPDFRNQLPVPAESSAVPPDHGFGCDNQECLPPSRPAPASEQPEEPVDEIKSWAWMTPFQHRKLLA